MPTGTPEIHVHPEYGRLFHALDDAGVAWCLVRPEESLHEVQKDLDLLVAREYEARVLGALQDLGYQIATGESRNPGKVMLVRWTGEEMIAIDLHLEVVMNGFVYLDARGALGRRVERDGVWFLCPADMFVVLLVHDIVGKGLVQDKYHGYLRRHVGELAGSATQEQLKTSGLDALTPTDSDALEALLADEELVKRRAVAMKRMLAPGTRWRRFAAACNRHWRKRRGTSVAFVGPDGCGKSTTVEAYRRLVEDALFIPTTEMYMGPWGHDHLRLTTKVRWPVPHTVRGLLRERRRLIAASDTRPSTLRALSVEFRRMCRRSTDRDREVRNFLRATTWPWMVYRWVRGHIRYWIFLTVLWFELWYRYQKVWRAKRWGAVVVCDRYVFDLLSGSMHGITKRYHFARALFCALFPKPDVTILLHDEAEALVARKDDLDLATMKKMLALYKSMQARWGFHSVQTNVPPLQVARLAIDASFVRIITKRRV